MKTKQFYYECPDCGFVTTKNPTEDNDTTEHICICYN